MQRIIEISRKRLRAAWKLLSDSTIAVTISIRRAVNAIMASLTSMHATGAPSTSTNMTSASNPLNDPNPARIDSLHGTCEEFPLFRYLPMEVQIMIWSDAVDFNPRNVPVGIMPQMGPGGFQFYSNAPIPECFVACKDYYKEAKKRYNVLDGRLEANDMLMVQHIHPNFWFNPAIDISYPVEHWSTQNFEVGLKLFFDVLKVSKIAISEDCAELPAFNLDTWYTFLHKYSLEKWSPDVKEIFYYITTNRLNTDVELSFGPTDVFRFYFPLFRQTRRHWEQVRAAKKGFKYIIRVYANQNSEDIAAGKEGRPRIKVAGVPQWLFDVQSDWLAAKPQLMIETRSLNQKVSTWGWYQHPVHSYAMVLIERLPVW
ncbi:hypothetical protein OCU04_009211 [Sclerotinia nivalis]|uniref:2EXR domain-containing protein n=1 Tax=Sclerotinia nivalis TaxID=352851 RepID=A0A9X0DH51_9HELO|nr:hypothetical protein OCU04_009211 [Sclerotinia nivalis]